MSELATRSIDLHPFDPARDYEVLAGLVLAANLFDGLDDLPTADHLRTEQEHLDGFDPARDVVLAEVDGTVCAAGRVTARTRDGRGSYHFEFWIAPAGRGGAVARALLHWLEGRAIEIAGVDGRAGPHSLEAWIDQAQAELAGMLADSRYRVVRHGLLMRRDLGATIELRELPTGFEIRPVAAADMRRIWDADVEAFRDGWNSAERTEADYQGWLAEPDLDTGLWRVAWAADEVVGSVQASIVPAENAALGLRRGWLNHVNVRRPWRRQGVATALISAALLGLRTAGMAEAVLGVDAENPTGAVQVYEGLGFHATRTTHKYTKEL